MSTTTFTLSASKRSEMGKGASRRLRRQADLVPAIVYGAGSAPENISIEQRVLRKALENEAFYSHIIELAVDGKNENVVLKALQRHPYKSIIMHADFLRVDANAKIHMHVPLHFKGEEIAPGVKTGGGIMNRFVVEVEITCLPSDLPEFIEVDVSKIEIDEILHLSNLTPPKGVVFTALSHGNDIAIVGVHLPRGAAQQDDIDVAAAEKEAAAKVAAPIATSDKKNKPKTGK
ncbi:MAG: 50S ribosomal protein L25/general stress protein Ctc [Gammaproteobacteria bacterium]|nr:50S ribosomal protein L25/general stress protein Ctc [Gammaproteobacteria bacterium]